MRRKKTRKYDRFRIIKKYITRLKEGLDYYNEYLNGRPIRFEILGIQDYYQAVCCAVMIGNFMEINAFAQQMKQVLSCVSFGGKRRKEDLRLFLATLKNMKDGKNETRYTLSELDKMIRVTSFSDVVKEKVKSPLFVSTVSIISAVAALIALLPILQQIIL